MFTFHRADKIFQEAVRRVIEQFFPEQKGKFKQRAISYNYNRLQRYITGQLLNYCYIFIES